MLKKENRDCLVSMDKVRFGQRLANHNNLISINNRERINYFADFVITHMVANNNIIQSPPNNFLIIIERSSSQQLMRCVSCVSSTFIFFGLFINSNNVCLFSCLLALRRGILQFDTRFLSLHNPIETHVFLIYWTYICLTYICKIAHE